MYPGRDLAELARTKSALREVIACRRTQCISASAVVLRPLGWIDTVVALWRALGPFARLAAWPLGAAAMRSLVPRPRIVGTLLRWAPAVFAAAAVLRRIRSPNKTRQPVSP